MERASVLTSELVGRAKKGDLFSGVVLIQDTSVALTKTGKEYIQGSVLCGTVVPIKCWSSYSAFTEFKNNDYNGMTALVTGEFDDYGGFISMLVKTVTAVEGYNESEFMETKYDTECYWAGLQTVYNQVVESDFAKDLAKKVLFENESVAKAFKLEFAAKSHHDNCKSGLLAHTYKVINNMGYILRAYPTLKVNKDLVMFGALIHDIGKIKEMHYGVYSDISFVTHRYLGIEYLEPYKQEIIANWGEKGWYELVSIMLQHHGEFEDNCRSLSSFLIHKADWLDSDLTLITQSVESNPDIDKLKIGDYYLTL